MNSWPITIALPTGLTIGGVTTWAVLLASKLAELGHDARLILHAPFEAHTELEPAEAGLDPRVHIVRAPGLKDPLAWDTCVQLYREQLPTLLLPNVLAESYGLAAVLAAAWPERVRVLGWCHSDNPYDYAYLSYYEPVIQQYAGVSERCADELRRRLPGRGDDVTHLPYGVHIPPPIARAPLGDRPVRLVYGGRMEQVNKRVLSLVDLARLLDQDGVWFELRFVGDGPQVEELRDRAAAAQTQFTDERNRIFVEPAVHPAEMRAVWGWADVSLLASGYEGFSISMIEAMACGCVPLVTRVRSGVADIIRERENGLTFPVDDMVAAADAVEWLAGNEAARAAMSAAARQKADELCGYERYAARVLQVFERAAAQAPRMWPGTRPVQMSATGAVSGMALCNQAEDRLRRVLRRIADDRAGPVAIYGGGNHTRSLGAVWAESPVPIVAVLDDDPGLAGKWLWGWSIALPTQAAKTGARSVLISSWMHEEAIWERRAAFERQGLRVYRIYGEDKAGGSGKAVAQGQALKPVGVGAEVGAADKALTETPERSKQ